MCEPNISWMKALAQDQLRALLFMTKKLDCGLNIGVYDGDTSKGDRRWLRDNARLVNNNFWLLKVFLRLATSSLTNAEIMSACTVDHKSRHAAFINIAIP